MKLWYSWQIIIKIRIFIIIMDSFLPIMQLIKPRRREDDLALATIASMYLKLPFFTTKAEDVQHIDGIEAATYINSYALLLQNREVNNLVNTIIPENIKVQYYKSSLTILHNTALVSNNYEHVTLNIPPALSNISPLNLIEKNQDIKIIEHTKYPFLTIDGSANFKVSHESKEADGPITPSEKFDKEKPNENGFTNFKTSHESKEDDKPITLSEKFDKEKSNENGIAEEQDIEQNNPALELKAYSSKALVKYYVFNWQELQPPYVALLENALTVYTPFIKTPFPFLIYSTPYLLTASPYNAVVPYVAPQERVIQAIEKPLKSSKKSFIIIDQNEGISSPSHTLSDENITLSLVHSMLLPASLIGVLGGGYLLYSRKHSSENQLALNNNLKNLAAISLKAITKPITDIIRKLLDFTSWFTSKTIDVLPRDNNPSTDSLFIPIFSLSLEDSVLEEVMDELDSQDTILESLGLEDSVPFNKFGEKPSAAICKPEAEKKLKSQSPSGVDELYYYPINDSREMDDFDNLDLVELGSLDSGAINNHNSEPADFYNFANPQYDNSDNTKSNLTEMEISELALYEAMLNKLEAPEDESEAEEENKTPIKTFSPSVLPSRDEYKMDGDCISPNLTEALFQADTDLYEFATSSSSPPYIYTNSRSPSNSAQIEIELDELAANFAIIPENIYKDDDNANNLASEEDDNTNFLLTDNRYTFNELENTSLEDSVLEEVMDELGLQDTILESIRAEESIDDGNYKYDLFEHIEGDCQHIRRLKEEFLEAEAEIEKELEEHSEIVSELSNAIDDLDDEYQDDFDNLDYLKELGSLYSDAINNHNSEPALTSDDFFNLNQSSIDLNDSELTMELSAQSASGNHNISNQSVELPFSIIDIDTLNEGIEEDLQANNDTHELTGGLTPEDEAYLEQILAEGLIISHELAQWRQDTVAIEQELFECPNPATQAREAMLEIMEQRNMLREDSNHGVEIMQTIVHEVEQWMQDRVDIEPSATQAQEMLRSIEREPIDNTENTRARLLDICNRIDIEVGETEELFAQIYQFNYSVFNEQNIHETHAQEIGDNSKLWDLFKTLDEFYITHCA